MRLINNYKIRSKIPFFYNSIKEVEKKFILDTTTSLRKYQTQNFKCSQFYKNISIYSY